MNKQCKCCTDLFDIKAEISDLCPPCATFDQERTKQIIALIQHPRNEGGQFCP